jgi:hypothetical protein
VIDWVRLRFEFGVIWSFTPDALPKCLDFGGGSGQFAAMMRERAIAFDSFDPYFQQLSLYHRRLGFCHVLRSDGTFSESAGNIAADEETSRRGCCHFVFDPNCTPRGRALLVVHRTAQWACLNLLRDSAIHLG